MRARSLALPAHVRSAMLLASYLGIALLLLAGCDAGAPAVTPTNTTTMTATTTPTAASTPTVTSHPVSIYTCAAGSLPVGQGYTRTSCAVTTQGNYHVLRASYTGKSSDYFVNEQRLRADGWLLIQQEHGDSPNGSIGDAIYTGAGAWFAFNYDYPTGTYSLEQGVPSNTQAAGSCGQSLSAGATQQHGIPLPANSQTTDDGMYAIVPACTDDLQRFYTAILPGAGWTLTQPFQRWQNAQPPLALVVGTANHGSTNLDISLGSDGSVPTIIMIRPHFG